MQVPKTLTPADIAAIEKEIGSTREEREKHAMDMALNAGLRGSLMVGGAGVVGHMLAQKFWPWYKTGIYVQGKAFIVSSMFVVRGSSGLAAADTAAHPHHAKHRPGIGFGARAP